MIETITSKDNKLIKEVKKLNEKKYRTIHNKFIVEGFRFVFEALESTFNVPYVFFSDKIEDKFEDFQRELSISGDTQIFRVPEVVLNCISNTENPQGIVAVVENTSVNINAEDGFYVLVDKVQDPGNMGTIIRTANAAGANGVIITKGTVDIYNDKTLRATMGSIFKIPIIIENDFETVLKLKENGFKLIVSSLETDNNFYEIDLKKKSIIAVGNEGNGVSEEVCSMADEKVKIPMPGNAESLNVAVAAAIMIFEAVRQKNT